MLELRAAGRRPGIAREYRHMEDGVVGPEAEEGEEQRAAQQRHTHKATAGRMKGSIYLSICVQTHIPTYLLLSMLAGGVIGQFTGH